MNSTAISILATAVIIGGAIVFSSHSSSSQAVDVAENANNVSIVDGKQIVEVSVKAGYHPKKSIAKAGVPTILRFNTNGTYDCSSSVRIPSMGIIKRLPASGATDVDLGSPKVATLSGVCGMGMYSFDVEFHG
jgi:plastocyanin domain-containing protein